MAFHFTVVLLGVFVFTDNFISEIFNNDRSPLLKAIFVRPDMDAFYKFYKSALSMTNT